MGEAEITVYLETGAKRAFAGAVEWPGWCRSGREEAAALQALFAFAGRYHAVLAAAGLGFSPPDDLNALEVVERLVGGASTDFGAPEKAPAADKRPLDPAETRRQQDILAACWDALAAAAQTAAGKELRKGPRGGGRSLERIVQHVVDADGSYLRSLGARPATGVKDGLIEALAQSREAGLGGLEAAALGQLATLSPRGIARWSPRYYARRSAWHILDHVWEIEDRLLPGVAT